MVKALQQLGASYKQLSKAQAEANDVILDYANTVEQAEDPREILSAFPNMFGDIAFTSPAAKGVSPARFFHPVTGALAGASCPFVVVPTLQSS